MLKIKRLYRQIKIAGIENVIGGPCEVKEKEKVYCDLIILGVPAGLSAAIYSARSRLYTVILEGLTGGQVSTTFMLQTTPVPME